MNLKLTGKIVDPIMGFLRDNENQLGIDEETLYVNLNSKTDKSEAMGLLNHVARLTASLISHPKSC